MEITLALGGGGAKGNSHVGVIRRLEQEGFKIRAVAGTSFGGLVAVLYALGKSPDEIQQLFEEADQSRLFGHFAEDGPSLLGVAGVRDFLARAVGEKIFDDLKIPCAVTAVDVLSGGEVILSEGSLKNAILSTIALPGIFPVQRLNGWELVDGGVLNPVPVSVARMLSPGLPVVAVTLNDPMDKPISTYTIPMPRILPRTIAERITRMSFAQSLDIFMRSVDISSRAVAHFRLELDKPDAIIRPRVHDINLLEKVVVADVVKLGEQAFDEALPQLKHAVSWSARIGRKLFGTGR
ncbi:MAG: patatin-like phospholipase family protein [Chloroflexi bacterium]|nr:patatin-like phospholipase family protein [Chloroflexota bacterium]